MPSSSSLFAMTSLSSTEKETLSPCVPSRSVVSNVKIFMSHLGRTKAQGRALRYLRHSRLLFPFEEGHHFTQLAAHLLDFLALLGFPHGEEFLAAGPVFLHPLACEFTGLDLRKDLFHFRARLFVDDARTPCVIAVLGGVGDRVAHVGEASFVDQIDDQLDFMQTLEIGDLRCVAGFHQSFKSRADERADAAAQHTLLPNRSLSVSSRNVVSMTPA